MLSFSAFLEMALSQRLGVQRLPRRPEPTALIDADTSVMQYDRAMCTKLVLSYLGTTHMIACARPEGAHREALDLACGPGHMTTCLAHYLGYERVQGLDLSPAMVETARASLPPALRQRVRFDVQDIGQLAHLPAESFDLVSFTNAAHHLADLGQVQQVMRQMDRLARSDGLVLVMDLARLRTERLTERYLEVFSADYAAQGLEALRREFRHSLYAAYTTDELASAVPWRSSRRRWVRVVPRALPMGQFILGLPEGRGRALERGREVSHGERALLEEWAPRWTRALGRRWAEETRREWRLVRLALVMASRRYFPERAATSATRSSRYRFDSVV